MTVRAAYPFVCLALAWSLPFGLFGTRAREAVRDGRAAYERGDYMAARNAFETGLEDYPTAPELLYDRAVAEHKTGDYAKARATLESALTAAEDAGNRQLAERVHFAVGNGYFMEGRYREAIEAYDKALEIAPEDRALAEKMLEPPPPMPQPQGGEGDSQEEQSSSGESDDQGESVESDSESRPESESESGQGGRTSPESSESESQGSESQSDQQRGQGESDEDEQSSRLQGPYSHQGRPSPPAGTPYAPMPEAQADQLLERQKVREQYNAQLRSRNQWDPMAQWEGFEELFGQGQRSRSAKPPW